MHPPPGEWAKPARIHVMALDRPLVRAPELSPIEWLNTSASPSLADLRGQVVLIDFWDFTCANCLRTLPTLRDWHRRYQESGLTMLGIHTPEFAFARDLQAVRRAVGRLGIRWPVGLDNRQELWTTFANRIRPTIHLVDSAGYVRYRREGEGGYFGTERAMRALLAEAGSQVQELPAPLTSEEDEGFSGSCLPATPELQVEGLGNGPVREGKPVRLTLPSIVSDDVFYLEGEWRAVQRGLSLESESGELVLSFQGASVHAVLAARADDPAVRIEAEPAWIEILLDGERTPSGTFGQDLMLRDGGTWLRVDEARSYNLLQSLAPGPHELRLRFASRGTTLYSFSFETCRLPGPAARREPC
jgi:thiol-disulfide isomerase/thioredoxin